MRNVQPYSIGDTAEVSESAILALGDSIERIEKQITGESNKAILSPVKTK